MKRKKIGKICYLVDDNNPNNKKYYELINHQAKNISSVSVIARENNLLETQRCFSKSVNLFSASMLLNSESKQSFNRILGIIQPDIIITYKKNLQICNFVNFANIKHITISFSDKELIADDSICITDDIDLSSKHIVQHIENTHHLDLYPKHYLQKKSISYRMKLHDIIDSLLHHDEKVKTDFEKEWGYKLPQNPTTYNEKINQSKIDRQFKKYRKYVDKKKVRTCLVRYNFEHLLPCCYGIVKFHISKRLWQSLPNRFVIKPTNASGFNFIIEDKSRYDLLFVNRILSYVKSVHYGMYKSEPTYSFWNDFIITEYIEEATDYKFYCFNGKVQFVCTVNELKIENERHEPYQLITDKNFIELPFSFGYERGDKSFEKPKYFNEMIETVEKLSCGFEHIRVDMIGNKEDYYFAEYTFFPGGGHDRFYPQEYDSFLLNAFSNSFDIWSNPNCQERTIMR